MFEGQEPTLAAAMGYEILEQAKVGRTTRDGFVELQGRIRAQASSCRLSASSQIADARGHTMRFRPATEDGKAGREN